MENYLKEEAEIKETVKLIMDSSNSNPYGGKISKKDNIIAAIDLAKLGLDFANKGKTDEAMDIPPKIWQGVLKHLENLNK